MLKLYKIDIIKVLIEINQIRIHELPKRFCLWKFVNISRQNISFQNIILINVINFVGVWDWIKKHISICEVKYYCFQSTLSILLPPFPKDLPSFRLSVFPKDLPYFTLFLIWNFFPFLPSHVPIIWSTITLLIQFSCPYHMVHHYIINSILLSFSLLL